MLGGTLGEVSLAPKLTGAGSEWGVDLGVSGALQPCVKELPGSLPCLGEGRVLGLPKQLS